MKTSEMRYILKVIGLLLGFIIGIGLIIAFGIGLVAACTTKADPIVAATCPPEPEDAWILRRFGYCANICAGLPFNADVSKGKDGDHASCDCGRPLERIPKMTRTELKLAMEKP